MNFIVQTDEYGLKWLAGAEGETKNLCLPRDIDGIRTDAFAHCSHLQRVFIPLNIKFLEENVFAGFGSALTVYCEAEAEPQSWFRQETCLDSFSEDYDMYFEMEVRSWLGKYRYTCDSRDNITYRSIDLPHIIWRSTEAAMENQ